MLVDGLWIRARFLVKRHVPWCGSGFVPFSSSVGFISASRFLNVIVIDLGRASTAFGLSS
jgi:hypothetical protein